MKRPNRATQRAEARKLYLQREYEAAKARGENLLANAQRIVEITKADYERAYRTLVQAEAHLAIIEAELAGMEEATHEQA